jgi:hypothetical protein
MFAWRRANVAELNRLARETMLAEGRLSGPEMVAPGGARYATGDRIVTLAPAAYGQVVTSERGVVTQVDLDAQRLTAQMENQQSYRFDQEQIGAAQLAHGYATTVHRSQGATHQVAHVYEDGGGRELAYVAMSRASEETQIYVTADDLDQAREDLIRSWETERRWRWAIDTGTLQPDGIPEAEMASLRRQALVAARDALAAAIPKDTRYQLKTATWELRSAERDLTSLRAEGGRRSGGELGKAAGELIMARHHSFRDEQFAENKSLPRSIRRSARRHAEMDNEQVQAAEKRLEKLLSAEDRKLTEALDQANRMVTDLSHEISERDRWMDEHPKAPGQLTGLENRIGDIDRDSDQERWKVEGELNPRPDPEPTIDRSWSYDHSSSIEHDRDHGFGM